VLAVVASPAAAGQQGYTSPDITLTPPPGWSLTPAMGVSQTWDDNVTLKGPGDNPVSDVVNVANPRAELNYNGPRGQLAARYDGAFLLYRSSTTLNSYEQHGSLAAKRKLSTRTVLFINGGASVAPTTELLQLTAVPFVRAGARTEDARVGIESALSKRLSIVADVHGQQVVFDNKAPFANLLLGGTSFGAGLVLRERLSEQTTLTADYDGLRANIGERHDIFVVQNATAGLERQLTRTTRIFAAAGVARLDAPAFGPPKTGPSYRFGVARDLRSSVVESFYDHVPSWSFGGTTKRRGDREASRASSRRLHAVAGVVAPDDPLVDHAAAAVVLDSGHRVNGTVGGSKAITRTRQTVIARRVAPHNQIGIQSSPANL
jgi:hypothetical protein